MSPITDDVVAACALRARPGMTNRRVLDAVERFGSPAAAASAELTSEDLSRASHALGRLAGSGVGWVLLGDAGYPEVLAAAADAPLLLYVRGDLVPADDPAVAIVGSRRATPEGRRIAATLAEGLAALGVTVVSGLARGIDGEAHRGALGAGGRTLAVLGSGIDVIYPREHGPLAGEIAASGAVVSELPPGTPPAKAHFPMRNRILAGLARATVVVEAAERSGSLITARLAVSEGRAVIAVPGSPLSLSHRGTNRLIQDGARLLLELADVIDELPRDLRRQIAVRRPLAEKLEVGGDAERVLAVLSPVESAHLDEVAERAGLEGARVAVVLLELELAERVARLAGSRYVKLSSMAPLGAVHP